MVRAESGIAPSHIMYLARGGLYAVAGARVCGAVLADRRVALWLVVVRVGGLCPLCLWRPVSSQLGRVHDYTCGRVR